MCNLFNIFNEYIKGCISYYYNIYRTNLIIIMILWEIIIYKYQNLIIMK